jgi:hypothetical protein
MKKLFPLLVALLLVSFSSSLISQEMVSTDPMPRNVILEEFTGIHCGFCPDGHRIGKELASQYEGKVFLVNIHAGSYAKPGAGELDLRTDVGELIDDAAQVSGYPSGSVNRNSTPWGQSRSLWANLASGIMAETSPVNVAVKAFVDIATRELTVDVEYYYTSDGPSQTDYLTVMITQSEIITAQSGGSTYNPDYVTEDGKYRHQHALRMILTEGGAFGEPITTTTKGSFEARQYKITLPEMIKDVPVELYNLEVVAFVSGNKSPIYSGHGGKVDFDKKYYSDLGLTNLTEEPEGIMFTSINPKCEVVNNGGNEVTSFEVTCTVDGVEYKETYAGSLMQDDKATIDWGEIQVTPGGTFVMTITGFDNINDGALMDMDASNNSYKFETMAFSEKAFGAETFGFNTAATPKNCAFDQSQNDGFYIYATQKCGANNTQGAIRFALHSSWGFSGKKGIIVLGACDLSQISVPYLSFWYAYTQGLQSGSAPTIFIETSTNYGTSWEIDKFVTCEQTADHPENTWYVPASDDYIRVNVNMTSYMGKDVLVRLSVTPGTDGNSLYLDEITFGEDPTSVEEIETVSGEVYPNPVISSFQIDDRQLLGKKYVIYSSIGQAVASGINDQNKFDVSNLNTGSYFIIINNEVHSFIKK